MYYLPKKSANDFGFVESVFNVLLNVIIDEKLIKKKKFIKLKFYYILLKI